MRFGEPHWLWLALLAPALAVFLLWAIRRKERDLSRWCHPNLWNRMVPDRSRFASYWKGLLLFLAVCFLALMAARPQLGSRILAVQRKGIDVVIALDTSESMLAEDLQPNRITRARQEIQSLIERLRGDRVGLVAFSGEAFVQCPLTLDYAAARMFLRFMDTDLIPTPGTAIAEAIRAATKAFDPKERKFKALVLITDGEDHEGNVEEAAREAKEQGVKIFAVGVGTTKGEPIPMRDASGNVRDYKRDRGGNVVLSRLDPTVLQQICEETGGRYYDGSAGGLALDRLYTEISGMEQKEMKGGIVTQYEDRYVYFAAAALVLLALEALLGERRRRASRASSMAALLLITVLPASLVPLASARAADQGTRAFQKGNYEAARDAFEAYAREHPTDPRGDYNLGTALHQTGEMGPAGEALHRALRSPDSKLKEAAFYNLGNTRARGGDLPGAIEAYEMALRLNPKDQDAKQNLEIVRALQQQSPPDSTSQNKKQNQDKKDQDKKDQKKNDQQNGDQKNDDQKNQDQKNQDQKNQDQQDQNKQDQSKQDQNQQDQQKQDQAQNQQQDQQNQDQQKQDQQNQQQQNQQQQGQQGEQDQAQNKDANGKPLPPMKITPEQARQILEGLQQQEMMLQAERLKARSRSLKVEKDW